MSPLGWNFFSVKGLKLKLKIYSINKFISDEFDISQHLENRGSFNQYIFFSTQTRLRVEIQTVVK